MSDAEDPRCPECGGPIGRTATYCMHCSADLTDDLAEEGGDPDVWDGATASSADSTTGRTEPVESTATTRGTESAGRGGEPLLDPDGLVDDALTVAVGIAGGIVVGAVGTLWLLLMTGSGWALLFGLLAWLGATAYLVRRRTVQGAVEKSGYAVAVVLLLVPVVALSPVAEVEGGLGARGGLLVVLGLFAALPAAVAAAIGWLAGRFVPEGEGASEG